MAYALVALLVASFAGGLQAQEQKTADVAKRGLKPTDFPRTKQLAPGVYSYEALRAGDPGGQMTTVSLIVITQRRRTRRGRAGERRADERDGRLDQEDDDPADQVRRSSAPTTAITPAATPRSRRASTFVAHPASKKVLDEAANPPFVTKRSPHRRVIHLGATDVEILFLGRAHTGGDLSVYLPKEKCSS